MRYKIQQRNLIPLSHLTLQSLLKLYFPVDKSQHQTTEIEDDSILLK